MAKRTKKLTYTNEEFEAKAQELILMALMAYSRRSAFGVPHR